MENIWFQHCLTLSSCPQHYTHVIFSMLEYSTWRNKIPYLTTAILKPKSKSVASAMWKHSITFFLLHSVLANTPAAVDIQYLHTSQLSEWYRLHVNALLNAIVCNKKSKSRHLCRSQFFTSSSSCTTWCIALSLFFGIFIT